MPIADQTTAQSYPMQVIAEVPRAASTSAEAQFTERSSQLGLVAIGNEVVVQTVDARPYVPKMFIADPDIAQPIIDRYVPKDRQVNLRDRIVQQVGAERFDKVFLSQKMLSFNLDGVKDEAIKNQLIAILQTSPFSIVAIEAVTKLLTNVAPQYPTADFMMRLTKLDDTTAQEALDTEATIRQAYLHEVGEAIATAVPASRGLISNQLQAAPQYNTPPLQSLPLAA